MSKFILVLGTIISVFLAGSAVLGLIGYLGQFFTGEFAFHYTVIVYLILAFITIKNIVKASFFSLFFEGLYIIYFTIMLLGRYQYRQETFDYLFKLSDNEITQEKMLEFFEALLDSAELPFLNICKESYIYFSENPITFISIFSFIIILYWLRYCDVLKRLGILGKKKYKKICIWEKFTFSS